MTARLFFQAIAKFFLGVILVGLLVFLPAGTLAFSNGWLLMGILFIPMFLAGIVMMCRNPDLLKKRLQAKETQREQGLVVKLSGLMFMGGFVVAGLGQRFGWYTLPVPIVNSATLLLFLSMPLVLGSIYSFLIFLAYPFIIAKRIRNEEAFLSKELDGYEGYMQRVRYRLLPFIW